MVDFFKWLWKWLNPRIRNRIINPILRKRLHNKQFTLIANNCIGGCILHDLGVRFDTPFINLWLPHDSFLRFVNNIEYYIGLDLIECNKEEYDSNIKYPVGRLGDVVIYFQHYHSFTEAKEKWVERAARIHPNSIYILFCTYGDLENSYIDNFSKIQYKKALVSNRHIDLQDSHYIHGMDNNWHWGQYLDYVSGQYFGRKYYDDFKFVKWLNT